MWRWNFEEFIRFFQKGLNLFKIRGRFKLYFVPKFLTFNPEGIWSWYKKESCSLCFKLSLCKIWRILDIGKVTVLNFKVWVSKNQWNYKMKPDPLVSLSRLTVHTQLLVAHVTPRTVTVRRQWPLAACAARILIPCETSLRRPNQLASCHTRFYAKTEYSSYAWPRIKCSTHTAKSAHS
jgi:hypothetical protein